MTDKKKQPKSKNSRYVSVSHANKVFDEFFEEQGYERLSDMYEEIAEYSGVSPSTVAQMRLKGLLPSYISAIKIAEFIGVEPTDIWSIEESEDYQSRPKCIIEGCDRVGATRGLCMKHVYHIRNIKGKES